MKNSTGIFFFFGAAIIVLGVVLHIAKIKSVKPQYSSSLAVENFSKVEPKKLPRKPAMATYMHLGNIYVKDLKKNTVKRISKTPKVGSPKFSPDGKHIIYVNLAHFTGGFPRYTLFISDVNGSEEKSFDEMGFNYVTSRLFWSDTSQYLGLLVYSNLSPAEDDYHTEVRIYDTATKQEYILGKSYPETLEVNEYVVSDFSCNQFDSKTMRELHSFCTSYLELISHEGKNEGPDMEYEKYLLWNDEINKKYGKPGYEKPYSDFLPNGLAVVLFYAGTPQNPEAKWEMGGGSFIPGFDKGVTETYTLLIDKEAQEVITELPQAADADFFFE